MSTAGSDPLAQWREVGEWWNNTPPREIVRSIDAQGNRREWVRELPPLGSGQTSGQKPYAPNHQEEWSLRERKIRDEKASAACGHLPESYYARLAEERQGNQDPLRTRSMGNRPDLRPALVVPGSSRANVYAPLHLVSGYAFGRSIILAEEAAILAAKSGCPAAAIADPFSLTGCVEFVRAARRQGIKPIVGMSVEIPEGGSVVLLAQSRRGYRALSRLATECHLGEERLFPLATWERLARHTQDLICVTGGDTGPIDPLLAKGDFARAERIVRRLRDLYGPGNVVGEIERSWLPWQRRVERAWCELSETLDLPLVAGGSVTHARPEHFPAQDVLVCAQTLATVEEVIGRKPARAIGQPEITPRPVRAMNAERYLRTGPEMAELFADRPEWLAATVHLAERFDDDVLPERTRLPALYPDDAQTLSEIIRAETPRRYARITPGMRKRLAFETERIIDLGFATHFLVSHDFCRWADAEGIQYSGRGSVVDSAVAYVLGFSRIDAIRHQLHFDRFLPADGTKRPDIDIDFEARRRDDVRNYMARKYGREHMAQVSAIGAYCTRGILRDVGKAMGLSEAAVGFLAKRIHGSVPPDQILAALERKPELRESGIPRERFRWVFRLAERLMDVPQNLRCHSSGVVVSADPIADTVPTEWSGSPSPFTDEPGLRVMQWDKRSAKYYFDKFDILCLRGQDVLSRIQEQRTEPGFSVTDAPIDDPETFRAFRSGELIGIPQSASPAMRQAHVRLRTQDLTDASLVQAGIRPGVGGAVKINELIARRRGKPYAFLHPDFEPILGHTYGIIVFQEQVDQLLQVFGGYSGGQAEDIRDAIHMRRREDFGQTIRESLLRRVMDRGYGLAVAEQVFELVSGFKGYGFAQGHALAFAEISIRCVHLQQNYPAPYFAALLSSQPAGYYGPATIANEARSRGVQVLGPCVNRSQEEFAVEDVVSPMDPKIGVPEGGIRTALAQIHGLDQATRVRILSQRDAEAYTSVFDFAVRVRPARDQLIDLILCGAFDALHPNRRALLWGVPTILAYVQGAAGPDALDLRTPEPPLPENIEDFTPQEKAIQERRLLSMDVEGHLMRFERERVRAKGGITTAEARKLRAGDRAIVVGNPIRLRFPPTPSGKRVVFFDLEDETGMLNVTCFDAAYQRDGHAIVCSPYVTLRGEAQDRDGHTAFLASRVFPYRPCLTQVPTPPLPLKVADFLVG